MRTTYLRWVHSNRRRSSPQHSKPHLQMVGRAHVVRKIQENSVQNVALSSLSLLVHGHAHAARKIRDAFVQSVARQSLQPAQLNAINAAGSQKEQHRSFVQNAVTQ